MGLQPGLGARQSQGDGFDRGEPGFDPGGAGGCVAGRFAAGVHPDDPVAIGRGGGGLEGPPDAVGVPGPRGGGPAGFGPVRRVGLGPVPKPGVLATTVGHDRDETPTVAGDMTHRLLRAQLAVRDIQEPRLADEGTQFVPGRDVGEVVGGVAVRDSVGDRDRTVGADREDEQQLFEVGAVVLVVAVADRGRGLPAAVPAVRVGVVPGHGDGGRVVVQLGGVDVERADHPEHRGGDQARPISVEQSVKGAAYPVVVEQFHLARREPEDRRVIRGCPLAQGIDRPVTGHDVADHRRDHGGWRQSQPWVIGRQVVLQLLRNTHPVEQEVHDR